MEECTDIFLKELLEGANDAVVVINANHEIVYFNSAAEEIFKYHRKEVLGQSLHILIPQKHQESHKVQVDKFQKGSVSRKLMTERDELSGLTKGGGIVPIEVTISKIESNGALYSMAIVRDVTEKRKQAQEQKELLKELESLNKKLSELDAAKDKFLGMAAHDIRGPLCLIKTIGETLQEGGIDDKQRDQFYKMITRSVNKLIFLVEDLLDISKIKQGKLELNYTPIEVKSYVENIYERHKILALKKQITLQLEVPKPIGVAEFDGYRMEQVLDNLLSNAIKYSNLGSKVLLKINRSGDFFTIAVKDQGQGIPEAEFDRLFGEFERLTPKPTAGESSTGLGLAISKKIVELHYGNISVKSVLGEGSEFKVTIPLSRALNQSKSF